MGKATKEFLINDRQKLLNRFESRSYRLIGEPTINWVDGASHAVVNLKFLYDYTGRNRATGNATVTLNLNLIGGVWKITGYYE